MMEHSVYKLVELVGSSPKSIEDAIEHAIKKCAQTVSHLEWFKVKETRGRINADQSIIYQVVLKAGFRVEN